jgi:DNA-binding CsgD family transcriptional regulator
MLAIQVLFTPEEWTAIRTALCLSPRESDVTLGLLAGETEADIAARLGISAHTVHCHLSRLHRKLNVQSKSDLLLRVFRTYLSLTRIPPNAPSPVQVTPE